jgi:hypothetical protein
MSETLNRGYPIPDPTVPADVPYVLQQLGQAIDTDVDVILALLSDVAARTPYKQASGSDNVTVNYNVTNGTATVALPAGFTVPPNVTVTINSAPGGNSSKIVAKAIAITATQFTLAAYVSDNTTLGTTFTLSCSWHAIQMTDSSADG